MAWGGFGGNFEEWVPGGGEQPHSFNLFSPEASVLEVPLPEVLISLVTSL